MTMDLTKEKMEYGDIWINYYGEEFIYAAKNPTACKPSYIFVSTLGGLCEFRPDGHSLHGGVYLTHRKPKKVTKNLMIYIQKAADGTYFASSDIPPIGAPIIETFSHSFKVEE